MIMRIRTVAGADRRYIHRLRYVLVCVRFDAGELVREDTASMFFGRVFGGVCVGVCGVVNGGYICTTCFKVFLNTLHSDSILGFVKTLK